MCEAHTLVDVSSDDLLLSGCEHEVGVESNGSQELPRMVESASCDVAFGASLRQRLLNAMSLERTHENELVVIGLLGEIQRMGSDGLIELPESLHAALALFQPRHILLAFLLARCLLNTSNLRNLWSENLLQASRGLSASQRGGVVVD